MRSPDNKSFFNDNWLTRIILLVISYFCIDRGYTLLVSAPQKFSGATILNQITIQVMAWFFIVLGIALAAFTFHRMFRRPTQ